MDFGQKTDELIELIARLLQRPVYKEAIDLSRGEGGILMYLCIDHDGATSGELREQLEVGSGRIANALKDLEAKGLVRRSCSDSDKRKVIVNITDKGRRIMEERHRTLQYRTEALLRQMGEKDTEEFLRLLNRALELSREQDGEPLLQVLS